VFVGVVKVFIVEVEGVFFLGVFRLDVFVWVLSVSIVLVHLYTTKGFWKTRRVSANGGIHALCG